MSHRNLDEPDSGQSEKNLIITMILNLLITIAEVTGGLLSGSLALISDALHNFSDGIAIIITYIAIRLAKKPKTPKYTFGLKRAEIIAAIINSSTLIIISFFLIKEAIVRFYNPTIITGSLMLIVATIGLFANVIGTLLMKKGSRTNLNIRAAYIHLLSDAISSFAIITGAIFIILFEIYWLDPVLTILISLYILKEAYNITKEAIDVLMMAAPQDIDLKDIKNEIEEMEGIINSHHLHLWKLNDNQIHLEAHIEVKDDLISNLMPIKNRIEDLLCRNFNINHTTLQFEIAQCENRMINSVS